MTPSDIGSIPPVCRSAEIKKASKILDSIEEKLADPELPLELKHWIADCAKRGLEPLKEVQP